MEVEEFIKCRICENDCMDPRIMSCMHSFCYLCLDSQIKGKGNYVRPYFYCPICDADIKVENPDGANSLPVSWLIFTIQNGMKSALVSDVNQTNCEICHIKSEAGFYKCVDCCKSMCTHCLKAHSAFFDNHNVKSLLNWKTMELKDICVQIPEFCGPHKNERLTLFCESCQAAICRDCKLVEHLTHLTKELTVASTDAKEKLYILQEHNESLRARCLENITALQDATQKVGVKEAEVLKKISEQKHAIFSILNDHFDQLQKEVKIKTISLRRDLDDTLNKIKREMAKLDHMSDIAMKTLEYGRQSDTVYSMQSIKEGLEKTDMSINWRPHVHFAWYEAYKALTRLQDMEPIKFGRVNGSWLYKESNPSTKVSGVGNGRHILSTTTPMQSNQLNSKNTSASWSARKRPHE